MRRETEVPEVKALSERVSAVTTVGLSLWVLAVLTTLGDFGVTVWGLQQPGVFEAVPISRVALDVAGPLGLLVKDAIVTLGFGALFLAMPRPYRLSVPMGIAGARGYLVATNLAVLGVV